MTKLTIIEVGAGTVPEGYEDSADWICSPTADLRTDNRPREGARPRPVPLASRDCTALRPPEVARAGARLVAG